VDSRSRVLAVLAPPPHALCSLVGRRRLVRRERLRGEVRRDRGGEARRVVGGWEQRDGANRVAGRGAKGRRKEQRKKKKGERTINVN
jgi:hypothetical protein